MIRTTVPLSKAREIAATGGVGEDFEKALIELERLDYATVDVCIEYGDDPDDPMTIALARTNGIMVGFFLPSYVGEQIALPGGEPVFDLHITLAYLGTLDDMDVNQQRALIGVVAEIARDAKTLSGVIQGLATFPPDDNVDGGSGKAALYAGVTVPGLFELRQVLIARLQEADLPVRLDYPNFVPHVTLAYVDPETVTPDALSTVGMAPVPVTLGKLTAAIGGAHFDSTMFGGQWPDEIRVSGGSTAPSAYRPQFTKAVAVEPEAQITIGPFYVPDFVDGHGDWVATEDLEPAFHDWMAGHAHEGIRLQHDTSIVAGQVVEGYILRADTEFDVPVPGSTEVQKVLFPKGTPMVGTRWNDWAWPLVKSGDIRGLSMGGRSVPVEQDLR